MTIQETMNRDQVMNMISERIQKIVEAFQSPPPLYHPQVSEEQQEETSSLSSSDMGHSANLTVSDSRIHRIQTYRLDPTRRVLP